MDEDRRELGARWTITARLEITSAAQIGSHEADYCDQTFARDPEGRPVLPGTTLAGALRSALDDRLAGYRSEREKEPAQARDLFGFAPDGDENGGHESRLIVFDSVALALAESSLRDGVGIDPCSGLARDRYKYDREVSLPGVTFPLRVDLLVPRGADETALLAQLDAALRGLTDGSIRLGARRSRGLGQCRAARFRAERYDLGKPEGWLAYAESDYGMEPLRHLPGDREKPMPAEAMAAAWDGAADIGGAPDARERLHLRFDLSVDGTLLIRSPGRDAGDADMTHLSERGEALLSGTSVAGALRAQANRILHTLGVPDARRILNCLFGKDPEDSRADGKPTGSRVFVSEQAITGSRTYRQSRVKIDRFTGGALETALFDEEPCVGGRVAFTVEVRQAAGQDTPLDAPLMLLVARDLLEGLRTLGGEASVGRGVLRGSVTATLTDGRQFVLTTEGSSDPAQAGELDALLQPLLQHLPPAEGGRS